MVPIPDNITSAQTEVRTTIIARTNKMIRTCPHNKHTLKYKQL